MLSGTAVSPEDFPSSTSETVTFNIGDDNLETRDVVILSFCCFRCQEVNKCSIAKSDLTIASSFVSADDSSAISMKLEPWNEGKPRFRQRSRDKGLKCSIRCNLHMFTLLSWKLIYLAPWEKENHLEKCLGKGYVSSIVLWTVYRIVNYQRLRDVYWGHSAAVKVLFD